MPIIKPRGLLRGDRMSSLSDEARLYWPFLYAGSNGYGRFEMDYRKILERCFGQFQNKPTKELIVRLLREYRGQSLLFVYVASNGQRWGAWDSAAVQSFYTKEDEASPNPPEPEFSNWKKIYQQRKAAGSWEDLDIDGDNDAREADTKNEETDISPKRIDIDAKSISANRTSISESVSQHSSSVTSQHPNISRELGETNLVQFRPRDGGFKAWFGVWSSERGNAYECEAEEAWTETVPLSLECACFECTLSYLAGHESTSGFAPHNFLRVQVRNKFQARWPPLSRGRPRRTDELNRRGIERAMREAMERNAKRA